VARPAILILAYDGECSRCCRFVDWIQKQDRWGLVIPFPIQNPELVRMAPELAGHPVDLALHGAETDSRLVTSGRELAREIARRLPGWSLLVWAMPLLWFTPFQALAHLHTPARGR
jgi:predicted DCC family thiol-disulfide oxidoreductase YuxK